VSDDDEREGPRPPVPTAEARSGCLTAMLVVCGVILLFPGLCAIFLVSGGIANHTSDVPLIVALLAVGCVGVAVLWWAIRRRRP
jgi:cytochrome bd-type quinol oxidase subunit 2